MFCGTSCIIKEAGTMKKILLLSALWGWSVVAQLSPEAIEKMLSETWDGNASVVLSVCRPEEAPQIDGKISEQEWSAGVKYAGFIRNGKGLLPVERGYIYLARDAEHIYVGVKTSTPNNDPGGGLVTRATERDGGVYYDDSIELIFNPWENDRDTTYHLLINSKRVIFDRKHSYSANKSDNSWNIQHIEIGSRAESNWWDIEVKIPLSEFGIGGSIFSLNVARNWQNGIGSTALIPAASHLDKNRMLTLVSEANSPVLRMHDLGAPEEGNWRVDLEAANLTSRPLMLAACLRKYSWPKVDGKPQVKIEMEKLSTQALASGESAKLLLSHDTSDSYIRKLSVALIDQESGRVYFRRLISAQREVFTGNHPATGTFEMSGFGTGVCWYYPSFNKVSVRINLNSTLKPREVAASAGAETLVLQKQKGYYSGLFEVPSQEGDHPLSVSIRDEQGKQKSFANLLTLTKKKFPWENNRLGCEPVIIPPFTPIAAKSNQVDVLLRSHRVSAGGLWDSLVADGAELLAAPMSWQMVVDGKGEEFSGEAPHFRVLHGGHSASAAAVSTTRSGLELHFQLTYEYDGFYWVNCRFDKVPENKIDRLTLVIPLKDEQVPLFHIVSNTIRSNPGGAIPDGEGQIWDGSMLARPKGNMHPQLVPYLWLGGVIKGLSWFTDSSFGYKLAKDQSAVRLIRKEGILRVEIDIINRPVRLENGHSFAFGMQATPVKPVDLASRRLCYDTSGEGIDGMLNIQSIYLGLLGYPSGWSKIPAGGDYSMVRYLTEVSRQGLNEDISAKLQEFINRHDQNILAGIAAIPSGNDVDQVQHYQRVRKNFIQINYGPGERRKSLGSKYSDPRLIYKSDETAQYFKSEWWIDNVGYFGAWRSYPVRSNLDYMVYAYAEEMKNGLHGVYLDDMFLMPNCNPDTVARIDDEGELHSQIGILVMRELVKRLAVLQHQYQLYPRHLQIHMTNAQLVPCFSFATAQLSWERMFGETPLPERYRPDEILAEGIGERLGLESIALGGILKEDTPYKDWAAKKAVLTRSFLALSLPYGIKGKNRLSPNDIDWPTVAPVYEIMSRFGFWEEDCRFVPCWEKNPDISCSSPNVLMASYHRPGKILLILGNTGEKTAFSVAINQQKLELPRDTPILDLESMQTVNPAELTLAKYDFKIIQIGKP